MRLSHRPIEDAMRKEYIKKRRNEEEDGAIQAHRQTDTDTHTHTDREREREEPAS